MHGEQTSDLFDREASIVFRLHSKSDRAGITLIKDKALGMYGCLLKRHSHGLLLSAYQD
jgi:hypothetical protein